MAGRKSKQPKPRGHRMSRHAAHGTRHAVRTSFSTGGSHRGECTISYKLGGGGLLRPLYQHPFANAASCHKTHRHLESNLPHTHTPVHQNKCSYFYFMTVPVDCGFKTPR